MILRTKVTLVALASVVATSAAGLLVERRVIRKQGIELIRDKMRATILTAESARQAVSAMRSAKVFDDKRLEEELRRAADFHQTAIYSTVPVVAAWNAIQSVAEKEHYRFRVPADNPRNRSNAPDAEEARLLRLFENHQISEAFEIDEKANEVVYARPIQLTADCLTCHGSPANSPRGDGKDLLGFPMEDWKVGQRHGMFLLRSSLGPVEAAVRGAVVDTALWLLPLSLLLGGVVYLVMQRINQSLQSVVDSLREGSQQVSQAIGQLAAANHSLAEGASVQAASLEQTSAACTEITSMTERNAELSKSASAEMERVERQVTESNAALGAMVQSMEAIQSSSGKIARIIKVIDEIAFQTNILALNAAVEAARAGTAGAGFAVVADEVRNLAQRSAAAASDTAVLIEESIARAAAGDGKVSDMAAAIQGITDSAGKARGLIHEVSNGSREQTKGVAQIARAVQQMDSVTQHAASTSEQTAAASAELQSQAKSMDGIALKLRALVTRGA